MIRTAAIVLSCLLLGCGGSEGGGPGGAAALDEMAAAMAFYASYEDGMDGAYARDDRRVYSAPSYEALSDRGPWYWGEDVQIDYDAGIAGHALSFTGGLSQALFYTAEGNAPWSAGGALSVWIRPARLGGSPVSVASLDAAPALSIALSAEPARLTATAFEQEGSVALDAAPDQWRHLVISVSGMGPAGAETSIYLDGEQAASFAVGDPGAWAAAGSTIRLGVNYVGLIDELATFDRALTPDEIELLHQTPNLPASLMR